MTWKLEYDGVRQTFEEWEIESPVLDYHSKDADTFDFIIGADIDSEPDFDEDEFISVYRSENNVDTRVFYGRIIRHSTTGGPDGEQIQYHARGPWYELQNRTYQISWKVLKTGSTFPITEDKLETVYSSHLLLNLNSSGAKITVGEQIQAVVDYAASVGVAIQIDTANLPAMEVMIDEVRDLKCEAVILRELRWVPDAVTWFDYSTTPPTLKVKQVANLTAKVLDIRTETKLESVNVSAHNEVKLNGVVVKFEQVNTINGVPYSQQTVQKYPADVAGTEFKCEMLTISLEGFGLGYTQAAIVCSTVQQSSVDWWTDRVETLASDTITGLTLVDSERTLSSATYPRELVSGQIASWMGGLYADDTATATFSFTKTDVSEHEENEFKHSFVATNLTSGTYSNVTEFSVGESVPVGMAQYIYESANVPRHAGAIRLNEDECSGTYAMGHKLTLRDAQGDRTCYITAVREILDDGQTELTIGPMGSLGAADIIELLRMNRRRTRITAASALTSGKSASGSPTLLGEKTPKGNSQFGGGRLNVLRIGGETVVIDSAATDKTLAIRTVKYCDNGTERYITGLFSAIHDDSEGAL